MNREFIVLSDGNVAITDENGQILKRGCDNSSVQEILLAENKVELIDNKLEKLNKDLHELKGVVFLSKCMLIATPILVLLCALIGFVVGGLKNTSDFIIHGIQGGVSALVYSSIFGIVEIVFYGVVKPLYMKKVKKTEKEIALVKKLKHKYEKELSEISKIQSNVINETINNPVSLIDKTNIIETKINSELNELYEETLNAEPKRLILRRNK